MSPRTLVSRAKNLIQELEQEIERRENSDFPQLMVKAFSANGDHGTDYIVSRVQRTDWECTCADYRFRRRECKHIIRTKMANGIFESPVTGRRF